MSFVIAPPKRCKGSIAAVGQQAGSSMDGNGRPISTYAQAAGIYGDRVYPCNKVAAPGSEYCTNCRKPVK